MPKTHVITQTRARTRATRKKQEQRLFLKEYEWACQYKKGIRSAWNAENRLIECMNNISNQVCYYLRLIILYHIYILRCIVLQPQSRAVLLFAILQKCRFWQILHIIFQLNRWKNIFETQIAYCNCNINEIL